MKIKFYDNEGNCIAVAESEYNTVKNFDYIIEQTKQSLIRQRKITE